MSSVRQRNRNKSKLKSKVVKEEEKEEVEVVEEKMDVGEKKSKVGLVTGLLFVCVLALYLSNGDYLPGNDSAANMILPFEIMGNGKLTFRAEDHPSMFSWVLMYRNKATGKWGQVSTLVVDMDKPLPERAQLRKNVNDDNNYDLNARELFKTRRIQLNKPRYFVLNTTVEGEYANVFGIGAGITAIPFMFPLLAWHGMDVKAVVGNRELLGHAGKFVASFCVAVSVIFVWWTCLEFDGVTEIQAMVVTLSYAIGTIVWSISSQALWQHGPNEMYISIAMYLVMRLSGGEDKAWIGGALGLAVAMATVTRPTSGIIAVCVGLYLLINRRWKALLTYVGCGGVIGGLQLWYNWHFFGNALDFGQSIAAERIVKYKYNGATNPWQTPLLSGMAMLLISPSRGLFIYSPFQALVIFRWIQESMAKRGHLKRIWPFVLSLVVLWVTAFKFFDYWGGWCFGPRPLVDTMPILAMMFAGVISEIWKSKSQRLLLFVLIAMGVAVQVLGGYAYNTVHWNSQAGYQVDFENESRPPFTTFSKVAAQQMVRAYPGSKLKRELLNIDREWNRWRLWDWSFSQIKFYYRHFWHAREFKRQLLEQWTKGLM